MIPHDPSQSWQHRWNACRNDGLQSGGRSRKVGTFPRVNSMSRAQLLRSIAARVGDYRAGEIAPIDSGRVERWLNQFDQAVQDLVLVEVDHVLSKTYIRRGEFETFFAEVITDADLVGDDPNAFWVRGQFFDQPQRGHSQSAMLQLFNAALQKECGLSVSRGEVGGPVIYVDDAVYTGMHVINDLTPSISDAPSHTDFVLIFYAAHNEGIAYAQQQLTRRFREAGKTVSFRWFAKLELENTSAANSDVLWPKSVPDHEETRRYLGSLTRRFAYRTEDRVGRNGFFSAGGTRHILEQEFLKAGAVIRAENRNLNRYARPLGNRVLQSFGFGALIVTYRNCPNNCPLVFWSGDYPLFHRDNN